MSWKVQAPLLGLALALLACRGERPGAAAALTVVRVVPELGPSGTGPALFLNQDLTVYFSEPLDPYSISPDTVWVTDESGGAVRGALKVRSRSVVFQPHPPLAAGLSDGSFRMGGTYRLHVAGFPRANAVRDASGRVLDRVHEWAFRTVAAVPPGHASPLLPVGDGTEPFRVASQEVAMAESGGTIRITFTLPPLPDSLTPHAFRAVRVREGAEEVRVSAVRVLADPLDPYPGCSVEVALDPEAGVRKGELLFLVLEGGSHAVVDYRGRPVGPPAGGSGYLPVRVFAGAEPVLLEEDFDRPVAFSPTAHGRPRFEVMRGLALPRLRQEAGDGSLGVFRPVADMVLQPDVAFDRGDGTRVRSAGNEFPFSAIEIPAGVCVTVRSEQPLVLRSLTTIRIDGTLRLETPAGTAPAAGSDQPVAAIAGLAGCALVAGDELAVEGRVEHRDERRLREASALALVSGTRIRLAGRIPSGAVLAAGEEVQGDAIAPVPVHPLFTQGLAGQASCTVEAWTPWYPLPRSGATALEPSVLVARGDVSVAIQVATPDPFDTTRPFLDPGSLSAPIPLPGAASIPIASVSHVRFLLRATVRAGEPLPALDRVRVLPRR
ncbi:MAG: Ig-like domain-containing protein [Planctomycetes bacterium]|nr:Ig-like domain-containing protein [Planctomycetota bacterium]